MHQQPNSFVEMQVNRVAQCPCYRFDTTLDEVRLGKTGDLRMSENSFSFLCWAKLNATSSIPSDQYDQALLGQRDHLSEGTGLHIVIREMKPYFGFYGFDTASETLLQVGTWYHLSFVYDKVARTQSIYINGKLDARSSDIPPLRGNHAVFYSRYANGRPLQGLLAAPLVRSEIVATEADILHHMLKYSVKHAHNPVDMLSSSCARDENWPPARIAQYLPPLQTPRNCASDEFLPFLETGLAADVTVKCNGVSFSAHKIILAARSEYFRTVFLTSNMKEQQESCVELNDLDPFVLNLFLRALYTHGVEPSHAKDANVLLHFLQYCSRFQASVLGDEVERLVIDLVLLDSKHVPDCLPVAELYEFHRLHNVCLAINELFDRL